jgi:6-phosphogluconate dehydrogenase
MKIGIIGISTLTLELAFRSAEAGYKVKIFNPKGNNLIKDVTQKMGSNIQLSSINNCRNDVPCSEEQHQLNRRSEFLITKM